MYWEMTIYKLLRDLQKVSLRLFWLTSEHQGENNDHKWFSYKQSTRGKKKGKNQKNHRNHLPVCGFVP